MAKDVEYFFMSFLTIWTSFFENALLNSFMNRISALKWRPGEFGHVRTQQESTIYESENGVSTDIQSSGTLIGYFQSLEL
jgi:hypothetical protein